MAAADIAPAPYTPWTLRLFSRARVAPLWVGLAISAAWFAFYLLYSTLLGDGPGRFAVFGGETWHWELVWSLIIGMAPAVTASSMRGSLRDLEDLAPALRASPAELAALRAQVVSVPRGPITATGVVVAVVTGVFMLTSEDVWITGTRPSLTHPALIWLVGRNVINWWLISRAVASELYLARAFSRLGSRLPVVDLLDRTALAPFGRRGLRSVLLWMVYLSLFSAVYVMDAAEPILGLGLLFVIALALAAFLVPVWGAHLRMREAKAEELARVRSQLDRVRGRVLGAAPDETSGGHLADLVAWEQRVASAGEWPFGGSTLLRFGLYTAIGVGSWLGAAFVERLLERALG